MQRVLPTVRRARRITVIPAGLVALLPLHAAWETDSSCTTGRHYACDDVAIAYAPNARYLLGSGEKREAESSPRITAVHSPAGSRQTALPLSELEIQSAVASFISNRVLAGASATREKVLQEMQASTVVHISCHGSANLVDPLESGLMLADDERLTLRDILRVRFPKLETVVLSACETGVSGMTLPDEVVSLSTGLLQTGASGVVSTLWPVQALSTAILVDRFYHLWRREGVPAVEALRSAQGWLRDSKTSELVDYYERVLAEPDNFDTPKDVATGYLEKLAPLSASVADRRPFAAPFYWGPFQWAGHIGRRSVRHASVRGWEW